MPQEVPAPSPSDGELFASLVKHQRFQAAFGIFGRCVSGLSSSLNKSAQPYEVSDDDYARGHRELAAMWQFARQIIDAHAATFSEPDPELVAFREIMGFCVREHALRSDHHRKYFGAIIGDATTFSMLPKKLSEASMTWLACQW